jgi:beta-lactamase regulating signal transducer with metallopeptidase domain
VDVVLNWLWQGGIVALATAASLRMLEPSRAQARHAVVWVALLSVLALPAVPFIWAAAFAAHGASDIPGRISPVLSMPIGWWTSDLVVLSAWSLWSVISAARLAASMLALQRAKRRCLPLPPAIEQRLQSWTLVRMRGRSTRVVLSDRVRYAAVLGCGSPVIAVAPSLLRHLTDDELDRVVIHEWAHVQRHDDLARFAQLLVRAIVGWHPAVRWLDRQLDIEREIACDETAVAVTGSAKLYAACLAKLATLPMSRLSPLPVVAALSSSGLHRRVVRILSGQGHTARSRAIVALGVGLTLSLVAVAVGGWRVIEVRPLVRPDVVAAGNIAIGAFTAVGPIPDALASSDRSGARTQSTRTTALQADRQPSHAVAAERRPGGLSKTVAIADTPTPSAIEQSIPTVPSRPTVTLAAAAWPTAPDPSLETPTAFAKPSIIQGTTTSPWAATAEGGIAVGRQSQKAATATAGFFTRFGKRIGDAF